MSSSTSSSASSSSSSSSSHDGNGNAGGVGVGVGVGVGATSARRGGDFEGPSSSRRRAVNEVWPEPFVEALAAQVAIDASHSFGRLAAAPALANVFRVSSTWRAVSRSDLLWHRLTRSIWGRNHLLRATWRDEFVYWHRTAQNFRAGRSSHATLNFFDLTDMDDPDAHTCRCITLSDRHVACGFADGAVRLFDIESFVHIGTFQPHHPNRLGRFSQAVSGIVLTSNSGLVFARLDGDIHVAIINGPGPAAHPRRAHAGDVVRDGALVDFTGCDRWWVGLYAGAAGRAFHIWDGVTEELLFVGGSLTDPEAVMGWHMLTEATEFVGRVRVTNQELGVACTSSRVMVFDLRNQGVILGEEEYRRGVVVTSLDVGDGVYVSVDGRGRASVRRVETMAEVCRFNVGASGGGVMGCMNMGCVLRSAGRVIRVWGAEHGEYLYRFRDRVGELNAFVANERHVAAAGIDTTIHLWDFGAQ